MDDMAFSLNSVSFIENKGRAARSDNPTMVVSSGTPRALSSSGVVVRS